MRLLKIIFVIFLIYFIRRFIQMYRVMKKIQEEQATLRQKQAQNQQYQNPPGQQPRQQENVINAEYKVLD